MKKTIILNHKMSLLYDDLYSYIDKVNSIETDHDIVIAPSSIYLEAFVNNCDWFIAAQNMSSSTDKNHTGEISTDQLKSLGVEYVLVGHYERVTEFNESPSVINDKLIAALDANIFPVVCLGETLEEDYKKVIPKEIDAYLKNIDNITFITFAYEPLYAVGTGILPKKEKIEEVVSFIKNYLEAKYHQKPRVLYGGSVDSSNISDIMNIDNVDGVLIGSTSSDIKEVERIFESIE